MYFKNNTISSVMIKLYKIKPIITSNQNVNHNVSNHSIYKIHLICNHF